MSSRVKELLGAAAAGLTAAELAQVEADVEVFNTFYPGGLPRYLNNAKGLLFDAQHGKSYLTGCKLAPPKHIIHVPTPTESVAAAEKFASLEREGLELMPSTAFVLVAGGLGERLGYGGIKLALPVETATGTTFLEYYMRWIRRHCPSPRLAIMTSADTHHKTEKLLDRLGYCGWPQGSVTLLQQQSVFAFADGNGTLAMAAGPDGSRRLVKKPHGHGDVHALLYKAGLPARWLAAGVQSIVFLQDTNSAATITVPLSLTTLRQARAGMCFTAVPRLGSGEAVGALCEVTLPTGRVLTMNVEYNLFDPIYIAQHGRSEVVPSGGFSAFPGSINTLLLDMARYVAAMERTEGAVPEFVNPKYAPDGVTFRSPARLESLMQDVALALDASDLVIGIVFPRAFYAPVKNALSEAQKRVRRGLDAHSAGPGEAAVYQQNRLLLGGAGVPLQLKSPSDVFHDLPCPLFPIVAVDGAFGLGLTAFQSHFPSPLGVHITPRSVLVLRGDVTVAALHLDGALLVDAGDAHVIVDGLTVTNSGWRAVPSTDTDDEATRIRGFKFDRTGTAHVVLPDQMKGVVVRVFSSAAGEIHQERVVASSL